MSLDMHRHPSQVEPNRYSNIAILDVVVYTGRGHQHERSNINLPLEIQMK